MIVNQIVKQGENVYGIYESSSTFISIHYISKSSPERPDVKGAEDDVAVMFNAMELRDRRKGRR